jgi:hypothetical protein
MPIDGKFLTLLVFIIVNLLIIFTVKTRTTIVTSLIIAHLIVVLFFSLSISNYTSFKEIVLALIVYSMVILFLISNYNPIYLAEDNSVKAKTKKQKAALYAAVSLIVVTVFISLFSVIKEINPISEVISNKKLAKQEKVFTRPMLLPSHPVHIAVKKFYFGKKFEDQWANRDQSEVEINQRKKAQLKDKLSDNFLLKRSSDVILLIVAVTTSMLLLGIKKNQS